jgi:hypothetical protein
MTWHTEEHIRDINVGADRVADMAPISAKWAIANTVFHRNDKLRVLAATKGTRDCMNT